MYHNLKFSQIFAFPRTTSSQIIKMTTVCLRIILVSALFAASAYAAPPGREPRVQFTVPSGKYGAAMFGQQYDAANSDDRLTVDLDLWRNQSMSSGIIGGNEQNMGGGAGGMTPMGPYDPYAAPQENQGPYGWGSAPGFFRPSEQGFQYPGHNAGFADGGAGFWEQSRHPTKTYAQIQDDWGAKLGIQRHQGQKGQQGYNQGQQGGGSGYGISHGGYGINY